MRPGQAAPVFRHERPATWTSLGSFNEAGAGCPGILETKFSIEIRLGSFNEAGAGCPGIQLSLFRIGLSYAGFNEAGAGCPGILDFVEILDDLHCFASMRPGQAAPVFRRGRKEPALSQGCFNEAGAGCPGIRASAAPSRRRSGTLQ